MFFGLVINIFLLAAIEEGDIILNTTSVDMYA
jgi:hypothetical protein